MKEKNKHPPITKWPDQGKNSQSAYANKIVVVNPTEKIAVDARKAITAFTSLSLGVSIIIKRITIVVSDQSKANFVAERISFNFILIEI